MTPDRSGRPDADDGDRRYDDHAALSGRPGTAAAPVVVIGAGVAGLTAAHDLARAGHRVLVLDGADRIGGKLRLADVAGQAIDVGAEAVLARTPDLLDLVTELGLTDDVVHPATTTAAIAVGNHRHPVPAGTLLGVPTELAPLAASGLLDPAGLAAVAADEENPGPPVTADLSVAELIGGRLGLELLDRLVEPLLGGVYAGRTDRLSVQATMPALWARLPAHRSLLRAARAARGPAGPAPGPVFASLRGGLGTLPAALAATAGVTVRTGTPARELLATATGLRVVAGAAPRPEALDAAAVVVAVPPAKAARLLAGVAPTAAAELAGVATASVAVVSLAVPRQSVPPGSGLLVARSPDGPRAGSGAAYDVKAVTVSAQKWAHLAHPDHIQLRASLGRRDEEQVLQRSDEELVELVRRDLHGLLGITGTPLDARVTRWGGGLPQYDVGHVDRVVRIRTAVAAVPGLAVCGASYDGVGVAACIRGARAAARAVVRDLPAPRRG